MSALGKLVAVRYSDGSVEKGRTPDFKPGCTTFHLHQEAGRTIEVRTNRLKAVFFVRTPEGDPVHEEVKDFATKKTPEMKIWVEFSDGEELGGWSTAFNSRNDGFFFTPTDPDANSVRAYVYRAALKRVLLGPAAEQAAEAYHRRTAAS